MVGKCNRRDGKKPCAYSCQGLIEHSENSWKYAETFIDSNNWDRISLIRLKRLIDSSIKNLRQKDIKEFMRIAVVMHDIGKAASKYQEGFDDNCKHRNGIPSFPLHEWPSAYVVYEYVDLNIQDPQLDYFIRNAISLAVLLHITRDTVQLREDLEGKGDLKWEIDRNYLISHLDYFGIRKKNIPSRDPIVVTVDQVRGMKEFLLEFDKNYPWIHLVFLLPIIVGDNIDAYMTRGEKGVTPWRRVFTDELLNAGVLRSP